MMKFNYQAVNNEGKRLTGDITAGSPSLALRQLEQKGLTPLRLTEEQSKKRRSRRRLKAEELNVALYELATMLTAGVALSEAVAAQLKSAQHPVIEKAMEIMSNGLRQGQSFSDVLEASGLSLPVYVYQLVRAGEMTGALASSLKDAVDQMEYDRRTRDEMRSALIYPSILVGSGFSAVAIMFAFVVPKFTNLLEHADQLPLLAWFVLAAGQWTNNNATLLLAGVTLVATLLGLALSEKRIREQMINQCLHLPVLGTWLIQSQIAQWSKVLGTLLSNRVPLIEALVLSQDSTRLLRQRDLLERVTQDVRGGASLSDALEQYQAITPTGINLVRVGEKSGKLPQMLESLATLYDESSQSRMRRFLALIEPIAILIIGVMFGLIIAGIVLAITSANDLAI